MKFPNLPSYPYASVRSPSLSAREQVLLNEDLLYLVFSFSHSHLDRWTYRRQTSPPLPPPKYALLPAALTCKAFFLPAIRVLWFESSILYLLRVIPVLVRRGKTFILNGVITEEHMQRVDLYAGCIRRLHSFAFNVKVSSQVYAIVSRLRYPSLVPALKQLKFLSIHNMPLENLNSLFLIKSPTLADIQIGRIDSTTEVVVASFLQHVSSHAQTLDLKGRLTSVTFNVLPQFLRLKMLFLEIQPTTPQVDFLGMCAQIKTLELLWLGIHPEFQYTGTSTAAVEFSSLFSLIIAAPVNPMIDILGIFRSVELPRLGSIRLNFRPTDLSLDPRLAPCLERCVQIAQSRASPLALMLEGSITARWNDLIPLRELKKVAGLHILFEALSVTNNDIQHFFGNANGLC
ncbi:hypothetical protein CPB84DRAFT_861165 [Gymnopilus junonius]|uniref:Uncharacterized protein n=1 Tax=Gymnopilus junonius TaxID=109634 RepID=A0A9P5NMR5_GYMJU|nr:hypothetical protein CPB84DRAFT_861165 [Gymnopilus junonius]